jgi:hypothetical protein
VGCSDKLRLLLGLHRPAPAKDEAGQLERWLIERTNDLRYGTAHRQLRSLWALRVARGNVACSHCGLLVSFGTSIVAAGVEPAKGVDRPAIEPAGTTLLFRRTKLSGS